VNLIVLEPDEIGADGAVQLLGPRAIHLLSVLKVTPGQTVRLGVLNGPCGTGTVTAVGADAVGLSCGFDSASPTRPAIDLLLAVPRPKVMRRLWAQLAALGVGRVILTNAERVERPYFDTHMLDPACYRPLLIEGLQQARDTLLPEVTIHRRFRILIEDELDALCGPTMRLVAHPRAKARVEDVVRRHTGPENPRVLLAVGPEGGWNEFELRLLEARGFASVSMGPRTLRTDTACVALLALTHEVLNGLAPTTSSED
jgi:16S rRNA (uracil1498-N3)-methyltransferase